MRRRPGEAEQAGFRLERALDFFSPELPGPQQVEDDLDVDRARPGGHGHAFEWAEAHRRLDGAAVADGGDRAAAAEVANDEPRHTHPLGGPLHRQSLEAVA